MDNIVQYLSKSKVENAIKNLRKINWEQYNESIEIDEYVKRITNKFIDEFGFFPNILKLLDAKMFSFSFFRVREVDSFTNINNFAEHSYPPISVVKNLGRCNMPKRPVFYCSNNPMTALLEVIRENDYKRKKYCLSTWELIHSDDKIAFQTFLQSELHEKNQFNALKKDQQKKLNEPFNNELNKEQMEALNNILQFMDNQFIKDNNYSISASLAHQALYAKHNLRTDILMYPSVQTQSKGVNMAIHPNFVDNKMKIVRFYIIELTDYDFNSGNFKIELGDYGHIDKNVIMWKKITPNDKEYEKWFKKDFSGYTDGKFNINKNETQQSV